MRGPSEFSGCSSTRRSVRRLGCDNRSGVLSHRPSVSIQFAGSDASFKRSSTIAVPYPPLAELVGDFDGDGVKDLAVLLDASPNAVLGVLRGQGDGTFATPAWSSVPLSSDVQLLVSDIDGNGRSDLIAQSGSKVLMLGGGCLAP
jgi:hypothetical protein